MWLRRRVLQQALLISTIALFTVAIVLLAMWRLDRGMPELPIDRIAALGGWAAPLLASTAAIGVLTMSVLQLAKRLLGLRARVQRRSLESWIRRRSKQDDDEAIFGVIEAICYPVPVREALELPIEQLCGQITARIELILDPIRYPYRPRGGEYRYDEELISLFLDGDITASDIPRERGSLSPYLQRGVDALQIEAGAAWRRFLWVSAIGVSGAIAATGVVAFGRIWFLGALVFIAFSAIFGAVFSTIVRDLIAVVERGRR
jgi:hypothetical protein